MNQIIMLEFKSPRIKRTVSHSPDILNASTLLPNSRVSIVLSLVYFILFLIIYFQIWKNCTKFMYKRLSNYTFSGLVYLNADRTYSRYLT